MLRRLGWVSAYITRCPSGGLLWLARNLLARPSPVIGGAPGDLPEWSKERTWFSKVFVNSVEGQ
jgi:hypothetical protein